MTFDDLAYGAIDHALALVVPNVREGVFASPAERGDGTSADPNSLPEGTHMRLDPSLDLASVNMPPLTRMIAQAAQRYGIIIRDYSPIVAFVGQDPTSNPSATSLYSNLYGGLSPGQLLQYFPWNRLQVLRMDLHSG